MKKASHGFLPCKDPVTSWHTSQNVLTNVCSNSWCFPLKSDAFSPNKDKGLCGWALLSTKWHTFSSSVNVWLMHGSSGSQVSGGTLVSALVGHGFLSVTLHGALRTHMSAALLVTSPSRWRVRGHGLPFVPTQMPVYPDYLSLPSVWVVASFTLRHWHPQTGCAKF